jgi:hypothetical protein
MAQRCTFHPPSSSEISARRGWDGGVSLNIAELLAALEEILYTPWNTQKISWLVSSTHIDPYLLKKNVS